MSYGVTDHLTRLRLGSCEENVATADSAVKTCVKSRKKGGKRILSDVSAILECESGGGGKSLE